MSRGVRVAVAAGVIGMLVAPTAAVASSSDWGAVTSRVSVGPGGRQGNADSSGSELSRSGRYVVFASEATNLVDGDTNGVADVFVRDRLAGTTRRASFGPGTRQANAPSGLFEVPMVAVSSDGRYVAFVSLASNLVAGDTNGVADVFVRDVVARTTLRVSVGPGGRQADFGSFEVAISADGRHIAFGSGATNLVAGDTNGISDVFVRDRLAGVTQRVSVGPGGRQAIDEIGEFFLTDVSISADGRYVAFTSNAQNLVDRDTNGSTDVFVRDRLAGVTQRVSVGPGGRQSNGFSFTADISADGRFVALTSSATNLVDGDTNGSRDVFVRDRLAGTTRRVSLGPATGQANGTSIGGSMSADGRFVAFTSLATNLVAGDTNGTGDAFVRDRLAGSTVRVSVGPSGRQGNGDSFAEDVSADGRHVTFSSRASNLVPRDTNARQDVFARDAAGDLAPDRAGAPVRDRL